MRCRVYGCNELHECITWAAVDNRTQISVEGTYPCESEILADAANPMKYIGS